jgi:glycosyltransferase involved in cell wall biosynthesis
MRVLVATDAWAPQVNGVVRTYKRLERDVRELGVTLVFLTPQDFKSVRCPGYSEIRLALAGRSATAHHIARLAPDHIHIATEGPVGRAVRHYAISRGLLFTSSYHTKFPEYLKSHFGLPDRWTYDDLRRFHAPSAGLMVATPSLKTDLAARGFNNLMPWTRGVDTDVFRRQPVRLFGKAGPVFLCAGRVSKEKNLEAFLELSLPGVKVIAGDGPHLAYLKRRYPEAIYTGYKPTPELAQIYASADVFVFPSLTDTFGLVLLEALASGVPVAAFPVTGPLDIIENGRSGFLDCDLGRAALAALSLDRSDARARALDYSWSRTAAIFIENIGAARTSVMSNPLQTAS